MGPDAALGVMKAITISIIIGLILLIWFLMKRTSSFVSKKVKDKAETIISQNTIDKSFYAIAEQEIADATFNKGLWAKALVNAKGNEDLRKAEYIKLRAKQLQKEKFQN